MGSLLRVACVVAVAAAVCVPALHARGAEPDSKPLAAAKSAYARLASQGKVARKRLTLIDYSLPSTKRRLWVYDMTEKKGQEGQEEATGTLLFHELVAHGKNTGDNEAMSFGNESGSSKSSLGVFLTAGTYEGKHGYSLKLDGLEDGFNDRAMDRAIVIHGAWYVTEAFARKQGRLGRSWGCPAVDPAISKDVIDAIKDGSVLVSYFPDPAWLEKSKFLKKP